MNKILLPSILFAVAVGFSIFALIKGGDNPKNQPIQNNNQTAIQTTTEANTLFYGNGCPHCANVEAYLEKNPSISTKIKITRKEVYSNTANSEELTSIAVKCGMNGNSVGVPLLWDGQRCLIGDSEITNYLGQFAEK